MNAFKKCNYVIPNREKIFDDNESRPLKELERLSRLKSEDFNIVTSTCLPDNAVFMATEDIRVIGYLHGSVEYKIVGLVVIKNIGLDSE